MKRKGVLRLTAALLAAAVCLAAISVPALAYGGEDAAGTAATEPETEAAPEESGGETEAEDTLDQLTALLGGLEGVTVTEDGIQFSAETETSQTGTVTTNGGKLNVRTGAGLDNEAFTQLPNGTQVEVIGTEGEWVKILLPEREGYVHSDYLSVTGSGGGSFSLSLDNEELSALLELFMGGASDGSGEALTPDGNLSLIDDIGSSAQVGKQFITVETKAGNVFYLIIDRDDDGEETVHFLNQVDEADLLALTEDGEQQAAPVVCTCAEKCQAGAVNTACPVCANNMTECTGAEPEEPTETAEPEEPVEEENGGGAGVLLLVLLGLGIAGGAAAYFLVLKPKQGAKAPSGLDDLDLEDEEDYLDEDETEDME